MKIKFFTNWRKMTVALMTVASFSAFAEEAHFDFDAQETKEYAAFFKLPSALEGKCNAEVMGIDVHRPGFSWDDMNTWLNSEGKLWLNNGGSGYAETLFGICVNMNDNFKGKTSSLTWTTKEGDNKWYPAIANCQYLKGKLVLSDCLATVVHISGTQMDTVKIAMNNTEKDSYLHVRRNPECKQIDISNSKGKCRELHGYSNALSDENSFKFDNCRQTEFLDWVLNIENNCYTFSTLPKHPATGKRLESGYKDQWKNRGGYPIGVLNEEGEYEILVDEDIDFSSEYDIEGKLTNYDWKDIDGNPVELVNDYGYFCFGPEHVGKTYRCDMTNDNYPQLTLKTVFVTVVNEYSGVGTVADSQVRVICNGDNVSVLGVQNVNGIQVYSVNGQCVKTFTGDYTQFNVSDLVAGMYIVKVTTADGSYTAKILKK